MQFLYPWMLLGALGVSVPVAIHLLNRYRYRQVEWGAMELLRRAVVVRSRRIRLEDLLLMLLRCLIIALVALGLARPRLTPSGGDWMGRDADIGAVIAIDASFSMGHRPGVQSRFDRALDRAREVARTVKTGSPISVVLLGDQPRVLIRSQGNDPDRFEEALRELSESRLKRPLGPLPERLDIEGSLETTRELFEELSAPLRECYLITDAQAESWNALSEKSRGTLRQLSEKGKVFFLPVQTDSSENLAVTRFELKSGLPQKGAIPHFLVEVSNYGARPRENVPVSLLLNDVLKEQRVIPKIEAGKTESNILSVRFENVGPARLTARIGADELAEDNSRHLVADIRERTRILLIREPLAEARRDEKDYVQTALAARKSDALGVDVVSSLEARDRRLGEYQIVILSNVADLPDDQMRALYFFVKEGGSLIVFLGDNVHPDIYNARFKHEKDPLLPARLREVLADPVGWPIEPMNHPLSRVLQSMPSEVLGESRVQRYARLELNEGGVGGVKLKGRDETIVAEKTLGRGQVVLFATAAHYSWASLVNELPFPMLVHESLTFLGKRPHEQPVTVSEAINIPLQVKDETAVKDVIFQPAGSRPLSRKPSLRDGLTWAKLERAEQPGFYEVKTDPASVPLAIAVNVHPAESKVRPLTSTALTDLLQGTDVRLVLEGDRVENVVRESRVGKELWKELLIAALVVLLIEGVLSLWFTRRTVAARAAQEATAS